MIRAAHFDLLFVPFGRFCGAFGDVLDDEPSEREAEDGSDVNEASVDEGFDGFVLVGIFLTAVLQEFVAEDAEEFSGGEVFFFFETHASFPTVCQFGDQWAKINLPVGFRVPRVFSFWSSWIVAR